MSRPSRKPIDRDLYDAVVAEAKSRFDVWPSAYASGWVVKTYKARGGRYAGAGRASGTGLTKWFGEEWVDLSRPIHDEDGELVGYEPCGRKASDDPAAYPKCRPLAEALRMSPSEVKDAIKRKRAAEAKAAAQGGGRGGRGARAPVRVPTYRANPDGDALAIATEILQQAGSLTDAIDMTEQRGGSIPLVYGVPQKSVVDTLRSWVPAPLPSSDDDVDVFHATDKATAEQILREGVIPQLKPMTLARARYEAGEPAVFSPGKGLSGGIYVGASPREVESYGEVTLRIRVPRRLLKVSPEQASLGVKDAEESLSTHDGAVILQAIPPENIEDEARANPNRILDLGPVVATDELEDGTVVKYVASPFPYERKPLGHRDDSKVQGLVNLATLIGTQRRVSVAGVEKYLGDAERPPRPGSARMPAILVYETSDGRQYIADGHHRAVAALIRGLETFPAIIQLVRE